MGYIFLMAAAAACYPPLLAAVIFLLGRPQPVRLLIALLIGGMLISLAMGVAILIAIEDSGVDVRSNNVTRPLLDIVAGLLSLGVAVAVWRGYGAGMVDRQRAKRGGKGPSLATRTLHRGSLWTAFFVGVLLNMPGVWYLTALADIAHADLSTAHSFALVLGFNFVMFAVVEIPLIYYLVDPAGAQRLVGRLNAWLYAHLREIGVTCAVAIGVYLIAKGIVAAL